jgi:hypothetical protein
MKESVKSLVVLLSLVLSVLGQAEIVYSVEAQFKAFRN